MEILLCTLCFFPLVAFVSNYVNVQYLKKKEEEAERL